MYLRRVHRHKQFLVRHFNAFNCFELKSAARIVLLLNCVIYICNAFALIFLFHFIEVWICPFAQVCWSIGVDTWHEGRTSCVDKTYLRSTKSTITVTGPCNLKMFSYQYLVIIWSQEWFAFAVNDNCCVCSYRSNVMAVGSVA